MSAQKKDAAGKIQQSYVEVLDLNPDGVDLRHCVLGLLQGLLAFGFAFRPVRNIDQGAAVHKHALREFLQLFIYFFDQVFRFDGSAQQSFQDRQHRLRFAQ